MSKYLKTFITLLPLLIYLSADNLSAQELKTVPYVDLNQYAGKWYEIAAYPQRFQKGCHCTATEYTRSPKGYLIVENKCNRDSVNGKPSSIKGKAFLTKNSGNAKLNVQFFWPFTGKYWIIDLGSNYEYAVVSHPNKKYLWILSRKPKLNALIYLKILERLKQKGFDVTKLKLTVQS